VSLSDISAVSVISASYVSANFYAASASTITSYKQDMTIILILDTTSDGTVTLNVNSLGIKSLNKIDVNGNKVNFDGHELIKNQPNTFMYDGSVWVWMAVSYGDQIGVSGSSNNFTMISGCGILVDSGISSSSVALVTGSYIVLELNSNLKNEYLLSAGSGINITTNSSASTVTISTSVSASSVAPTSASYVVLSLNPSLNNEWLLTAGSNVTLTQNINASTITIDTNVSASSVATTGSYVMLALNNNVSGEWLLTAGDNIAITQNTDASTVSLSTVVAASSIAPSSASYVVLDVNGSLQNGLALTAGSNITIVRNTLAGTVKINSIPSSNSFYIDQSGGTGDTYGAISGSINGTNKVFITSQNSYAGGSLEVYLNGQLQTQGTLEDWTETSPAAGTFTFITAPVTGDLITAKYMVTIVTSANADTLDNLHASSFILKGEDITSASVAFTEAGALVTITSGENLAVLFGKVKKLFSSFFAHTHTGTDGTNQISGSYLTGIVPVLHGGTGGTTALGNISTSNMYNQQVTLYSGSWVTKSASVVVTYMTASAIVLYGPEPSTSTNRDAYYNADVYCSAQTTGSLTFNYMSSASPTSDIAVNVMFIV
jgi:hypothetical protein